MKILLVTIYIVSVFSLTLIITLTKNFYYSVIENAVVKERIKRLSQGKSEMSAYQEDLLRVSVFILIILLTITPVVSTLLLIRIIARWYKKYVISN